MAVWRLRQRANQTPYEENLTAVILNALNDEISGFTQTNCIGWRTARLALIVSYATHAELLLSKKEKKTETGGWRAVPLPRDVTVERPRGGGGGEGGGLD